MLAIQASGRAEWRSGWVADGDDTIVSLSFLRTRCFVSLVMQKARIHMRRTVELATLGKHFASFFLSQIVS